MMAMVASALGRQTVARFGTKQSPNNGPWAPWVAGYKGNSLLVRSGRLSGSNATSSTDATALIQNSVYYAGFIQGGTRKMVARPFIGISPSDGNEIESSAANLLRSFLL